MKPTRPLKPSSSEVRQIEQMNEPMWRVGLLRFEPGAGAHKRDRQHPGRVNELLREVDLEMADGMSARVVLTPALDTRVGDVLRQV